MEEVVNEVITEIVVILAMILQAVWVTVISKVVVVLGSSGSSNDVGGDKVLEVSVMVEVRALVTS